MDFASQEALEKTMRAMKDPLQRQDMINTPDARSSHTRAKSLAGSDENTDEIYKVAAEVLSELAKQNDGSAVDMMGAMGKAQADPKGFMKQLSPSMQKKIKALAEKIEAERSPSQTHD